MATDIATLGIKIDSIAADVASLRMDKLSRSSRRAEAASGGLARGFKSAARAMKVLIAAFALYKLAQWTKDTAMLAARHTTLGVVMLQVGRNAGISAKETNALAKSLQSTGISMIESRQAVIRMIQAQLDLTKATELARVAQNAAVIGNLNSSEAFARMVRGIQSGEVEILRNMGIQANFQKAYEKTAKAAGRTANSLSQVEKTQIRMNEVMEVGKLIDGAYESAMETAGKKASSLKRHFDDLVVTLGKGLEPGLVIIIDLMTQVFKDLKEFAKDAEVQSSLRSIGSAIATGFRTALTVGRAIVAVFGKIREAIEWLNKQRGLGRSGKSLGGIGGRGGGLAGDAGPALDMSRMRGPVDPLSVTEEMRKQFLGDALAPKRGAPTVKDQGKPQWLTHAEERARLAEHRNQSGDDQVQKMMAEIKAQEEAVKKLEEAEEKRLRASRAASDGAIRGLKDYALAATDTASQVENMVNKSFKGMEDGIVNFVKTGKLEFRSLVDSIIEDLIRMAVQQAVLGPLAQALGSFIGGLGGGGSNPAQLYGGGMPYARASGGPVGAGREYMVGEKGPEILRMGSTGGHITPNNAIGGSQVQVIINEAPAGTETREESGGDGVKRLIVDLKNVMASDVMSNGPLGRSIGSTFGLRRAGRQT